MVEVTEDQLLSRAVMRFGTARFERLAKDIVAQIKAHPPNAMFDENGSASSLWDNYCYDQQTGPASFLEQIWSDIFAPHLAEMIGALDRSEATLLTFHCCWEQGDDAIEIVGNPPIGVYEDALATAIMNEVTKMALDHELPDEDDDWSDDDDDSFED